MITARRLAWPVIVLSLTVVGVFQLAVADESAIGPWGSSPPILGSRSSACPDL